MALETLGYNNLEKKVYVYDTNFEIVNEYYIGECFVDFMEIDFSEYEAFYNDVKKIFVSTYSRWSDEDDYRKVSIDKTKATEFFEKYPLLKKEILKDVIATLKIVHSGESYDNVDLDSSLWENYFNFNSENTIEQIENYLYNQMPLNEAFKNESFGRWLRFSLDSVSDIYEQTWKFIYKYNNPYINNLFSIIQHPYMILANNPDCDRSIINVLYPHVLQNFYRDAYIFCFDVDFLPALNSLSAAKRFYIFNFLYPNNHIDYMDMNLEYHYYSSEDLPKDSSTYSSDDNFSFFQWCKKNAQLFDKLIQKMENVNVQQLQLYPTYKLSYTLCIEFHKMLENNIRIKKCKNCGKYFVLKGDYSTECCDRIPTGQKFTCKKIAAINTRKNKIHANPILKEYEKAYKRMYARLSNHKISNEDFRLWSETASQERDNIISKHGSTPPDDVLLQFKDFLGNR